MFRDPNIAFAAIVIGILIGYVELMRPGLVVPGVCGLTMAMLGIASLAQRNIRIIGLVCIAAGLLLMMIEARFKLHGVAALFGAALLAWGVRGLIEKESGITWWVAVGLSVPFVLITERLLTIALRARNNKLSP